MPVDPRAPEEQHDDRVHGPETFFARYEEDLRRLLTRLYTVGLILLVLLIAGVLFWAERQTLERASFRDTQQRVTRHQPAGEPAAANRTGMAAAGRGAAVQAQAATGAWTAVEAALERGDAAGARVALAGWPAGEGERGEREVAETMVRWLEGDRTEARRMVSLWEWDDWSKKLRERALPRLVAWAEADWAAGERAALPEWLPEASVVRSRELAWIRIRALIDQGLRDEARAHLRLAQSVLELEEQRLAEGDLELAAGRPEEAETYWRLALRTGEGWENAVWVRGVAERANQARRFILFREAMEKLWVLGSGPTEPEALWIAFVEAAWAAQDHAVAYRIARGWEIRRPDDPDWFVRRVETELREGRRVALLLREVRARRQQHPDHEPLAELEARLAGG